MIEIHDQKSKLIKIYFSGIAEVIFPAHFCRVGNGMLLREKGGIFAIKEEFRSRLELLKGDIRTHFCAISDFTSTEQLDFNPAAPISAQLSRSMPINGIYRSSKVIKFLL